MMGKRKADKNTLLLLHLDGDTVDETGKFKAVASDNNYGGGKFGSAKYQGYIDIPNAAKLLTLPEFTVDFFLKITQWNENGYGNQSSVQVAFDGSEEWRNSLFAIAGTTDWNFGAGTIYIEPNRMLYYRTGTNMLSPKGIIKINTWHHLAYTKCNKDVNVYVDGEKVIQIDNYSTNTVSINSMSTLRLMKAWELTYQTYGYMDEFRISNIARWTGNFTPPTKPY